MPSSEFGFLIVSEVLPQKGSVSSWVYKDGTQEQADLFSPFLEHSSAKFVQSVMVGRLAEHGIGVRIGEHFAAKRQTDQFLREWGRKELAIYGDDPRARAIYWQIDRHPAIWELLTKFPDKLKDPILSMYDLEIVYHQQRSLMEATRAEIHAATDEVLNTAALNFQKGLNWAGGYDLSSTRSRK